MLGIFSGLKSAVPLGKKIGAVKTEGPVALLHYRATTILFLSCCMLVTALEWIGNGANIACAMVGSDDSWIIPKGVINTYCYIQSTFIVPSASLGSASDQAHPGVGNGREVKYKAYYQWVSFLLFLQASLFYFPHMLFKYWEGGKVTNIISGLNNLVLEKDDRKSRETILARYLKDSLYTHNGWAVRLFLVRFVYLANIIFNLILLELFLDWEFSKYGWQVIDLMEDDPVWRQDPMSRIFPKVTKCSMQKFGPTGTIQRHDAICILPINIINEKIFVVLYFWLMTIGIITLISVVYNSFVWISPGLRNMMIRSGGAHAVRTHTLKKLDDISRYLQVGDWFLLYTLSRNLDPVVWSELVAELHQILKEGRKSGGQAAVSAEGPSSHSGPDNGGDEESELGSIISQQKARRQSHHSHQSHGSKRTTKTDL